LTFLLAGRFTVPDEVSTTHLGEEDDPMRVELLYFDGCPNWRNADARLRSFSSARGFEVERRRVRSPQEAERAGFRGSPTILVDGRDPFASEGQPSGFACRIYDTPDGPAGAPTEDQLRAVLDG
jgi:hypothetical protein